MSGHPPRYWNNQVLPRAPQFQTSPQPSVSAQPAFTHGYRVEDTMNSPRPPPPTINKHQHQPIFRVPRTSVYNDNAGQGCGCGDGSFSRGGVPEPKREWNAKKKPNFKSKFTWSRDNSSNTSMKFPPSPASWKVKVQSMPTVSDIRYNNPPMMTMDPPNVEYLGPPPVRSPPKPVPPPSLESMASIGITNTKFPPPMLSPPPVNPLYYNQPTTTPPHSHMPAALPFTFLPPPTWMEHVSLEGKLYYYNWKTNVSTWEKPEELSPSNDIQKAVATTDSQTVDQTININESPKNVVKSVDYEAKMSKPTTSKLVPDSLWSLVGTSDRRMFFYNAITKTSVWDIPVELNSRGDVLQMIEDLRKQQESERKEDETILEMTNVKNLSQSEENFENEGLAGVNVDVPPPPKKEKRKKASRSSKEEFKGIKSASADTKVQDDTQHQHTAKSDDGNIDKEEVNYDELTLSDLSSLKGISIDVAERMAAKERTKVPLEVRIQKFQELLSDKNVSGFSIWEKELQKIVFDPRYLLLTSKDRKSAFESYVKEKAAEEARENLARSQKAKDEFIKFIDSVLKENDKLNAYHEFERKYEKDSRMALMENVKNKKLIFMERLLELRKYGIGKVQKDSKPSCKNSTTASDQTKYDERKVKSRETDKTLDWKRSKRDFKKFLKVTITDSHCSWKSTFKKFCLRHDRHFSSLEMREMKELFQFQCRRVRHAEKLREERNYATFDKKCKSKKNYVKYGHTSSRVLRSPIRRGSTKNWYDHDQQDVKSDGEVSSISC